MKGATQCARRVKQALKSLKASAGKLPRPQTGDPIAQLVLGILSRDAPEAKAREALDKLRAQVVDFNELRVMPYTELHDWIGDYPDGPAKCEDLSRALNRIFAIEHSVTLDRLANASKTDVLNYLGGIPGLEAYTRARIRLLGLNQHAIPLDEAMWHCAIKREWVDSKATLEEAQSFLERQVDSADALDFFTLVRKDAWAEFGAAVRKGAVQRIRSVPPNRSTTNMLQAVASGNADLAQVEFSAPDLPDDEEPAIEPGEFAEEPTGASKKKSRKSAKSPSKPASASKSAKKAAAPSAARKPARPAKSAKRGVKAASDA